MGNHFYYYVVESARLGGQLWIVHQAYVGMADKVAALVKDCASPPLSAAPRDFRCPTLYGSERSKPACLARIGGALSQPPIWPSRTARSQYQTAYREARPAVFRAIDLPMAADVGCGSAIGKVMVDPNSPHPAAEATPTCGPKAIEHGGIEARVAELQRDAENRHWKSSVQGKEDA